MSDVGWFVVFCWFGFGLICCFGFGCLLTCESLGLLCICYFGYLIVGRVVLWILDFDLFVV